MTPGSILEHQQAEVNLKIIQSEQCSLQWYICISMGIFSPQNKRRTQGMTPQGQ